ncbi:MAG: low molecular weight protein arginine phosphatase [Candidatus Latescibacteria bacterium]|nr:low molecular weight protein arginine phosphatase [Candidatus Latescibacterota bacterium]
MNSFLLLFVCTGNICRSPMAEGIMKDIVLDEIDSKRQIMPLEILSAGTGTSRGHGASSFAVKVADEHGINLMYHRSRPISEQILSASDLILTMEQAHTDIILEMLPEKNAVFPLKLFGRKDGGEIESVDIIDPIGREEETYQLVFAEIQQELKRVSPIIFSLALDKFRAR